MKELVSDPECHDSKSLKEVEQYAPFDAWWLGRGCGELCPRMPAKNLLTGNLDPKHKEPEEFKKQEA
ncbi:MAG: hypothetical protein IPK57_15590 [Chitinophagaceae bacterium]|nr:hypothetical protein [Chitinophagaceae bacterium]